MTYDAAHAISIARHYADIGYHEGPNNHNDFSYWQYGDFTNPWCDSFVCYCAWFSGYRFPSYSACGEKGDYNVGSHHQHARRDNTWRDKNYRAQTGDLVVLSFTEPDQHIEMVDADWGDNVATIGGNTSNMVARRQRRRGNVVGFIALTAGAPAPTPTPAPKVPPMFNPPFPTVDMTIFDHPTLGRCAAAVSIEGHVICDPAPAYSGSPYNATTGLPEPWWGNRQAFRIEQPNDKEKAAHKRYTIVSGDGSRYAFP